MSEFDDKLEAACSKAVHIATVMLDSERAAHEITKTKLAVAIDGLERAALHARSAVKSWEAGKEHTVTHVRDAENAALVCDGVLAKIRGG